MTRPYPTGISRIERESTWLARIFLYDSHGRRTKITAKRFLDRLYNTKEESFAAACTWVQANQQPRPGLPIGIRLRSGPSRHSNTGYIGIYQTLSTKPNSPIVYDIYSVSYRDTTGRHRNKSFYWSKYPTPHDALQAALAFRQAREQEYIQHYLAKTAQ